MQKSPHPKLTDLFMAARAILQQDDAPRRGPLLDQARHHIAAMTSALNAHIPDFIHVEQSRDNKTGEAHLSLQLRTLHTCREIASVIIDPNGRITGTITTKHARLGADTLPDATRSIRLDDNVRVYLLGQYHAATSHLLAHIMATRYPERAALLPQPIPG